MELTYHVKDRPNKSRIFLFALQQLLSILAGTISLPLIVGNGLSQSAALFGASVGTLTYLLITKFKSPVFLSSSFTFLGSMMSAFAGAASAAIGYVGIIFGALMSGIVYVILSIVVHFTGTKWVEKVFPPVIIGPVVALIGLTLAPNAIKNITRGDVLVEGTSLANPHLCLGIGLAALIITIIFATHAKGFLKLIPFIFGIAGGYLIATIFTLIGNSTGIDALKVIDFTPFSNIKWLPDFAFMKLGDGFKELISSGTGGNYFLLIFTLYVPISFAVFAEHIADHKNLSSIIGTDLLKDPGLDHTLMGDGVGSMVGTVFGGSPNTTYGESISCVAFSRNASIITIVVTALLGIVISFIGPVMTFFSTIPTCVVGGLSIALYGYIAASGLKLLRHVDLNNVRNIFIISSIFVVGIGGLTVQIYFFQFSPVASALVVGLLVNVITHTKKDKEKEDIDNIPKKE